MSNQENVSLETLMQQKKELEAQIQRKITADRKKKINEILSMMNAFASPWPIWKKAAVKKPAQPVIKIRKPAPLGAASANARNGLWKPWKKASTSKHFWYKPLNEQAT